MHWLNLVPQARLSSTSAVNSSSGPRYSLIHLCRFTSFTLEEPYGHGPSLRDKNQRSIVQVDRSQLDLFEEASMVTTPATAIKTEIRELIDLQIHVSASLRP